MNDSTSMLRGGLIGCGYVSRFHLRGWQDQSLGQLVAVCDLDPERVQQAAATVTALPYSSAEQMLDEQSLDFVEICTTPASHLPLIRLAAKVKVSVLCQKPIAADLTTIDEMLEIARSAGIRVMVHENWRFRPWYTKMAEVLREGIIGEVTRLRVDAHDFRCLAPGGLNDQPYFAQMPRFILYEMGPHLVDVARHLLGQPESVYCATTHAGPQLGEDSAHLVLDYGMGKVAILDMCWATTTHPDDRLEWGFCHTVVEGKKGTLQTSREGQLRLDLPDGTSRAVEVPLDNDPRQFSYTATQNHFLECLRNGSPFATDLADNREAMRILFAGYKSAETGQTVTVR